MTSAYVFTGPTLHPQEARAVLDDAVYLPPVSQGDVYRAALKRPHVIGIIDGYFERAPAVWHKEILWALTQGIYVFGSASMGALRAAELAPFGMEGVGEIFESYRSGELEDDDEVAVVHGPAKLGYPAVSEAMVNIRRTLANAEAAGVITGETRAGLERTAKELFYSERTYPSITELELRRGLEEAEVEAFRAWLPRGRVNQKRADALTMLRLMKARLEEKPELKRPSFFLEHTVVWDRAASSANVDTDSDECPSAVPVASLLEELRMDGSAYARARQGALIRHLGLAEAERQRYAVDAEAIAAVEERFRRRRGLRRPQELDGWLRRNRVSRERFDELMREEALLAETRARSVREELRRLPDHLRLSGEYARLRERATDKRRLLEDNGLENPTQEDVGMPAEALVNWYFRERLGRSVREDNEGYSAFAELARDDVDAFVRAAMREYCYLRLKGRLVQNGDLAG